MPLAEHLSRHLALCDELYQLCVEENRILKQERRPPDAAWRERKQELSARLDASLAALRTVTAGPGEHGGEPLERARQRSLQILHLDRENEQLLLRCSLAHARPAAATSTPPSAALKAYKRT